MNSHRKTAIIVGILYITATVADILGWVHISDDCKKNKSLYSEGALLSHNPLLEVR